MEKTLEENITGAVKKLYGYDSETGDIQIQATRKEFEGDLTVVVFPLLKYSGKSPEETANDIGKYILEVNPGISVFNVVKGFLKLQVSN
jgi:arginyl-tRNA synthetase